MGCALSKNNKKDREIVDEVVSTEGNVVVSQWMDKRIVTMAFDFLGKRQCWSGQVLEQCWQVLHVRPCWLLKLSNYTNYMGGVEKRISTHPIVPEFVIFTQMNNLCHIQLCIGCWLEYTRDADNLAFRKNDSTFCTHLDIWNSWSFVSSWEFVRSAQTWSTINVERNPQQPPAKKRKWDHGPGVQCALMPKSKVKLIYCNPPTYNISNEFHRDNYYGKCFLCNSVIILQAE